MTKLKPPVEKNETIDVVFEDLTHEFSGVAKVEGYPIFVPKALPGEKATIKITKVNKNFAFGRLVEIHEVSPIRQEVVSEDFAQFGGCQLQHMTYEGQLKAKHEQVKNAIARIGNIKDTVIHPVIGMDNPWHYRNKMQVPVGEKNGQFIAGFYRERSHEIVDMDTCLIQSKDIDEIFQAIKELCIRFHIQPYNEEKHNGVLRHIMLRSGKNTGEVMICFITKTKKLPNDVLLVQEITKRFPNVKSITHNVNNKRTNVIFGEDTRLIYGSEYIHDTIGDIKFAISTRSFYQVNPTQTKVLYDKALEFAQLTGEETVMDAYCGIGTITLFLAQKAKKVYGVEIVPEAIDDAIRNVALNGITNVEFAVGEAEKVIPAWYEEDIKADTLVVDPPRKGCDEALLKTIIDMKPKRVVYVSCNPATLARDLRILEDGGYKTEQVQPVDMFPHTTHVECVVELTLP
jgi:23S rRNA (uracil1939-C5)-methyltransferase